MKDELENCVLKGYITACIQDNCKYWSHELATCTRESLKMTKSQRAARREAQRKEAEQKEVV